MRHTYQIIFRGTFNMGKWNGLLRKLYDRGIKYKCESKLSPTRDDAGLLKYYERVIFACDDYIPISELLNKEVYYNITKGQK